MAVTKKITQLTLGAQVRRVSANVVEEVAGLEVRSGAVYVKAGTVDNRYWPESDFEIVKPSKAVK